MEEKVKLSKVGNHRGIFSFQTLRPLTGLLIDLNRKIEGRYCDMVKLEIRGFLPSLKFTINPGSYNSTQAE